MLYTKVKRDGNVARLMKDLDGQWSVGSMPAPPCCGTPAEYRAYSQFCLDVANVLEALQNSKESK